MNPFVVDLSRRYRIGRSPTQLIALPIVRGFNPAKHFPLFEGRGSSCGYVLAASQKQRVLRLTTAVAQSRGLGQKRGKILDFSTAFHLNLSIVILSVKPRTDEKTPSHRKSLPDSVILSHPSALT